jgi:hypothetical protein
VKKKEEASRVMSTSPVGSSAMALRLPEPLSTSVCTPLPICSMLKARLLAMHRQSPATSIEAGASVTPRSCWWVRVLPDSLYSITCGSVQGMLTRAAGW